MIRHHRSLYYTLIRSPNYRAIKMSTTEMESVVMARMPNVVLTKVREDGDYVQFTKLRKEVYQSLRAVSTTYGAPGYDYRGLGMTDAKYFFRTGVHYVFPLNPGIYNVTIRATVSHITRSRREAEHNEARRDFITIKAIDSIIKKSTQASHPTIYNHRNRGRNNRAQQCRHH